MTTPPTRIVFWNVQQFSDTSTKLSARIQMFADLVTLVDPSIISIVEVQSNGGNNSLTPGAFITAGGGFNAIKYVISALQALGPPGDPIWRLVPPVNVGGGTLVEAVAVFYRQDRLAFRGPYYLSCSLDRTGTPDLLLSVAPRDNIINGLQRYSTTKVTKSFASWMPTRVTNPPIPYIDSSGTQTLCEDQLAGQYQFFYEDGDIIGFPNENNRAPFFTKFIELGPNGRTINLFTVHTSPNTCRGAVESMGLIPTLDPKNLTSNTVNVVGGDFNVDSTRLAKNGVYYFGYYHHFTESNYAMHLDPRILPPTRLNAPDPAKIPYCLTHLLPTNYATSLNQPTQDSEGKSYPGATYPSFGYLGTVDSGGNLSSYGGLDNVLTLYSSDLASSFKTTVINPVVQSPYTTCPYTQTAITWPQNSNIASLNILPYGTTPPPYWTKLAESKFKMSLGQFQGYFQAIHDVSDHLPVVTEI